MPANSAGRMYFYLGTANSQYFDFIEFTVGTGVFNGNTTRVDAFGLKIAMRLHSHDGADQQVGENYATFTEDRTATFSRFAAAVPAEFQHEATATSPFRIMAPGSDSAFLPGGQYQNYLSSYASSVGISATTQQIFGCSGLAGQPAQQCAALNRHTADLPAAAADGEQLLPRGPGQLLRQVLARQRARQARVRLPVRRRGRPVHLHLARQPAVPAGRRRLVTDAGSGPLRRPGPGSHAQRMSPKPAGYPSIGE